MASFTKTFLKDSARGVSTYLRDCFKLAASSGNVSKSTNVSEVSATIPIAEFNMTANRSPFKIDPPADVDAYKTSCNALCAAGLSSDNNFLATNGYASMTNL